MAACKACGLHHPAMMRCEVARRLVPAVVHAAPVVHASRHGKYADAEKRRAYRREWMRAKRAKA